MPSRKRPFDNGADAVSSGNAILDQVRNMWQFANLCQWIYIFGKAVKLDDAIDIDEIESACLKPDSTTLSDIALAILRLVSNHRGLTHDNIDGQAQKQYLARAPDRNPFGSGEHPAKFQDFDIFTKIAVLQQFTQWSMIQPDRLREKMEEQRDTEQTSWRIEPYGWDSEDRTYFVLDDNRVYRLTEAPPNPTGRPKKKKSNYSFGKRSSKRRRTETGIQETDTSMTDHIDEYVQDGLGGMKWECLAITLGEVRSLLEDFRKSRDENEKILRKQLEDHLVPILEKQEEGRKRKALQRERELLNLAKMATAKRSSRIANKVEQQKQEEKIKEEEQLTLKAEEARRKEAQAQLKQEQERDVRLASRENRLKEREARRVVHEKELAQLSAEDHNRPDHPGRVSERNLKTEIERNKQALEELDADEDWVFDCICGLYGQVDDGTHSVACENCNVWQHSKCLSISEEEAERPEFHFICSSCRHSQQDTENRPKPAITLKVHRSTSQGRQLSSTNQTTTNVTKADSSPKVPLSHIAPFLQRTEQEAPSGSSAVPIATDAINGHPSSETSPASTRETNRDRVTQLEGVDSRIAQAKSVGEAGGTTPRPSSYQAVSTPAHSSHTMAMSSTRPLHNREVALSPLLDPANIGQGHAGISPIKQSPPGSLALGSSKSSGINSSVLAPVVTLSPSARQPILTPPIKQTEPVRAPKRPE